MVDWECGGHADHRACGADTDVSFFAGLGESPSWWTMEVLKSEGGSLRSGLEYLIFHSFTWSFGRGRIGRVSWTSMAETCVGLGELMLVRSMDGVTEFGISAE